MAEGSDAITGKFDFYDILGYLVPGLVLLGLLTLPFGLIKGIWPSTSLASAVLYLVGAHILGHILQGFLRAWEGTVRIKDKTGKMVKPRTPSSVLLDADESLARFLPKIEKLTRKFWEIPKENESWASVQDTDRDATFLQARNLLLQAKKQSYFEQFQGKYALMGGMTAGLVIASAYYAGWAVALIPSDCIAHLSRGGPYAFGGLLAVLVVCFALIQRSNVSEQFLRVVLLLLLVGVFLGGFVAASASQQPPETHQLAETHKGGCGVCAVCCGGKSEGSGPSDASQGLHIEHKATFMLIFALVAFGAAVRCYGAYKAFAREFAMGVWRDFANFHIVAESANKNGLEQSGPTKPQ
jgi:hypothetical protein